jgi:hypothetical protein
MNVKDMPPLNSAPGHSQPAPEFNIPHITKADSPLRKVGSTPVAGPEGPKVPSGTSDSPGSASSQDAETKDADQKGSSINKTQEIFQINEEGKSVCGICKKVFSKPSQLRLHVNIHYFERPFRCEACAVSFRTKGHLQKHKRSVGHFNKVNINATFGAPSTDNPRPFKCSDCMIAFRIHGHLAKHLRRYFFSLVVTFGLFSGKLVTFWVSLWYNSDFLQQNAHHEIGVHWEAAHRDVRGDGAARDEPE